MPRSIEQKRAAHEAFWQGQGPSLILIPPAVQELYDLTNYPACFRDPERMWQSEIRRAEPVVDWPTDGIPTVRPNLGVTFVPAMAGLGYQLHEDSMPWPGKPLDRQTIRAAADVDLNTTETMQLASAFYEIHHQSGRAEIAAYHADTQGVFDIAHLLNGDKTFYEVVDPEQSAWLDELLQVCHDLYVRVTRQLKARLNEPATSMIHGHGTSQGVYFPHAGARMAEDTAILLSPSTIDRWIVPAIRQAAGAFGQAFVHFCGKHPPLLERLCQMPEVAAIDLGNPEMYETPWLLERCAESGTVLYSRLAAEANEDWRSYVRRLGRLVRQTGARVILRPLVFPDSRAACRAMQELWHELTQ